MEFSKLLQTRTVFSPFVRLSVVSFTFICERHRNPEVAVAKLRLAANQKGVDSGDQKHLRGIADAWTRVASVKGPGGCLFYPLGD